MAMSTETRVALQESVEVMWPALKNAVSLIAQHSPQFIHSSELLHGDGGPGSIRIVKFGPASGLVTYAKEEIVEVDEEKMVLTYLLLEGDLKKQFKVFKPSMRLEKVDVEEANHDGVPNMEGQHQSVATWRLEYEVEDGMPPPQIELLNEGATIFFRLLEASVKALQVPATPLLQAMANANPTPHPPNPIPHPPVKKELPTPLVA